MKSQHTTWEVIVAGCIFTALGVYLLTPSHLSIPTPEFDRQQVELEIPHPPGKPSISEDFLIELKELKKLKQQEELEEVEKELEKLEIALKNQTFQIDLIPSPSLKSLSKFLIYSP